MAATVRQKKAQGVRHPLSFRISADMLEELDALSRLSGRSRSQEAELLLERALSGREYLQDSLNSLFGLQGAGVINLMGMFLRNHGDWMNDPDDFAAMRQRFNYILDAGSPERLPPPSFELDPPDPDPNVARREVLQVLANIFTATPTSVWHRHALILRERLGPDVVKRIINWVAKNMELP